MIIELLMYLSAREAVEKGVSPIVIDNTNTQAWEMRAYVALVSKSISITFVKKESLLMNLDDNK